eukprot:GILJ01007287.1.p1 GENE.GILJ01007287.1~~GILJ01007287.1.p1  ORF type:complete len:1709 (-),score=223.17 GILJ01007287.1:83-4480(-)
MVLRPPRVSDRHDEVRTTELPLGKEKLEFLLEAKQKAMDELMSSHRVKVAVSLKGDTLVLTGQAENVASAMKSLSSMMSSFTEISQYVTVPVVMRDEFQECIDAQATANYCKCQFDTSEEQNGEQILITISGLKESCEAVWNKIQEQVRSFEKLSTVITLSDAEMSILNSRQDAVACIEKAAQHHGVKHEVQMAKGTISVWCRNMNDRRLFESAVRVYLAPSESTKTHSFGPPVVNQFISKHLLDSVLREELARTFPSVSLDPASGQFIFKGPAKELKPAQSLCRKVLDLHLLRDDIDVSFPFKVIKPTHLDQFVKKQCNSVRIGIQDRDNSAAKPAQHGPTGINRTSAAPAAPPSPSTNAPQVVGTRVTIVALRTHESEFEQAKQIISELVLKKEKVSIGSFEDLPSARIKLQSTCAQNNCALTPNLNFLLPTSPPLTLTLKGFGDLKQVLAVIGTLPVRRTLNIDAQLLPFLRAFEPQLFQPASDVTILGPDGNPLRLKDHHTHIGTGVVRIQLKGLQCVVEQASELILSTQRSIKFHETDLTAQLSPDICGKFTDKAWLVSQCFSKRAEAFKQQLFEKRVLLCHDARRATLMSDSETMTDAVASWNQLVQSFGYVDLPYRPEVKYNSPEVLDTLKETNVVMFRFPGFVRFIGFEETRSQFPEKLVVKMESRVISVQANVHSSKRAFNYLRGQLTGQLTIRKSEQCSVTFDDTNFELKIHAPASKIDEYRNHVQNVLKPLLSVLDTKEIPINKQHYRFLTKHSHEIANKIGRDNRVVLDAQDPAFVAPSVSPVTTTSASSAATSIVSVTSRGISSTFTAIRASMSSVAGAVSSLVTGTARSNVGDVKTHSVYRSSSGTHAINLLVGDIKHIPADAVVVPTDVRLSLSGVIAKAVIQDGSKATVAAVVQTHLIGSGPAEGSIVACSVAPLSPHIYLAVCPQRTNPNASQLLADCSHAAVCEIAKMKKSRRQLVMPAIGSGGIGLSEQVSADSIFNGVVHAFSILPGCAMDVSIVLRDDATADIFRQKFEDMIADSSVTWQWRENDGAFVDFDPDQSKQIEIAYNLFQSGNGPAIVQVTGDVNRKQNGYKYEVNVDKMWEINAHFRQNKRDIQRQEMSTLQQYIFNENFCARSETSAVHASTATVPTQNPALAPLATQITTRPASDFSLRFYGRSDDIDNAMKQFRKEIEDHTISHVMGWTLSHSQEKLHEIALKNGVEISFPHEQLKLTGLSEDVDAASRGVLVFLAEALSIKYPSPWAPNQTSVSVVCPVAPQSTEWKTIENRFKMTMSKGTITEINRIQHKEMFRKYYKQRLEMKQTHALRGLPPHTSEEKWLFHGTRKTAPETIYSEDSRGFDFRYSSSQCYWGSAAYFAENALYSHSYAYDLGDGKRQMFYASVLVGDCKQLDQHDNTLKHPPTNPDTKVPYDSVRGYTQNHLVYMIYELDVAYPHYTITYTYTDSTPAA